MRHRWSLAAAYAITVLVIIGSGVIAWLNAREQEKTSVVVIRAHLMLARLTDIETAMADAETGQRGFLLTGDEHFLEPYLAATGTGTVDVIRRPSVDQLLADARAIPSATNFELQLLSRAEQLTHEKLGELAQTISLRRAGRRDEAVAIVREGRGKRLMDALRGTLTELRAEERRQLQASDTQHRFAAEQAAVSNTLASVLALLTLGLLFVTSRRSARAALRKHHAFQMLADNMSQHAWTLAPDGQFLWFNRRWSEYTGLDPATDQGAQWREAAGHPVHRDRVASGLRHAVATGSPWEDIFPLRAADGSYQWFLVRALPIRTPDGQVTVWFGTNTNIDERLRLEQELKDGNRRKDEFIATLAHELRNPLAPIQAGLELMKLNPAFPAPLVKTRDIMGRQLAHLVRLIDDLLDVSRISSGKLDLQLDTISVRDVIECALETSRLHIESSGHTLEVKLPAEPLLVRGDLVRLAQVVANLLNNGAKYTPDGGRVCVATERDGDEAVIRVSDNGIGIDKEMLPHIFDLFSQAPSGRERRKGGIGIGLSIARRLVQLHGGTLTAASAGLGTGSTFTIRLPLAVLPAPGTLAQPNRVASSNGAALRVLILDDNADAAQTFGSLLEMAGHSVALAHTGQEAIDLAPGFRPDIAFLDIGLPDMDGYQVARTLRRMPALAHTQLVALTGWGAPRDRQQSRDAGFDQHLTKPVTLEALGTILPALALPSGSNSSTYT
ncbi:MAG: ATP-binding protein [Telluria sp.]